MGIVTADQLQTALERSRSYADEELDNQTGSLEERITALETHLAELDELLSSNWSYTYDSSQSKYVYISTDYT